MNTTLIFTLVLPLFISVILFISWKRNENKNPQMSKLALIFAIIFLGIAVGLGILWYLFSGMTVAV